MASDSERLLAISAAPAQELFQFVLECKSPPLPPRPGSDASIEGVSAEGASAGEQTQAKPGLQAVFLPLYPIAHYTSLPGNQPETYANNVALWNGLQPNLSAGPIETTEITGNAQSGDVYIPVGLQRTDYCMTYQCGSGMATMCAMVTIPLQSPQPSTLTAVSITVRDLSAASITFQYGTLPGYDPQANRNWIGIWPGRGIPYASLAPPVAKGNIQAPYSEYIVNMEFSPVLSQYTAVYFTGPSLSNIAAAVCFRCPA